MRDPLSRRDFLRASTLGIGAWSVAESGMTASEDHEFQLSLNEWSLARELTSGRLDHLDLARTARTQCNIPAVEYVSGFFANRVQDGAYLKEMNKRAAEHNVRQLLIVVHGEGRLGAPDPGDRKRTVRNHHKWLDAAEALGCHSIEVDTGSEGTPEEQLGRVAEGIAALCEYADKHHLNVLAGCRGRPAADASWLLQVIRKVDHPACGALPGFAGLAASQSENDVAKLLKLAKGINAEARDFDELGRETQVDFFRLVSAIVANGYRGYVGIVYQGRKLGELDGILATKTLLEAARRSNA
jgi:L-ribulose-5-phosphate 3-epimerase